MRHAPLAKFNDISNTQKMILLALAEGWRLRYADQHGWCLFQAGRQRPFAQIAASTVEKLTRGGWLDAGIATRELGFRPEKQLTRTGRRYAERLIDSPQRGSSSSQCKSPSHSEESTCPRRSSISSARSWASLSSISARAGRSMSSRRPPRRARASASTRRSPALRARGLTSYTQLKKFVQDRPGHDKRYAIDATRIETELGWRPRHSFESGLRETVAWYLEHSEWLEAVRSGSYRGERLGLGAR